MTTFGLVHGASHGAWCWERLAPELEARGARAVAVDLPCADPAAGAIRYAEVVAEALAAVEGKLVLVGHSLGGVVIPLVAELRPVARLVYVAAFLPQPGRSVAQQLATESVFVAGFGAGLVRNEDGSSSWRPEAALETLYHDCDPEVTRRAVARLRPQAPTPLKEPCPLAALPAVPSAYVLCRDDRVVDRAWARRAVPERLGVEPRELPGGHCPLLARPAELAAVLIATVSA